MSDRWFVALAILLRPIAGFILMVMIVLPIEWLLFQVFPRGRVKVMLFRNRTGEHATRRDKVVMAIAVVMAYALLIAFIGSSQRSC